MLKNKFLTILIISFFSIKSFAVEHPEYINWRAHPREFVISLSEAIEYKIGGIKHGLYLDYVIDYLESNTHYLSSYGYYNNGKANGAWKSYFPPYKVGGEVILGSRTEYNNGVRLLEERYYALPSKLLSSRSKYNTNGKLLKPTAFYKNGQMEHMSIYDGYGTLLSKEEWYENGRKK